MSWLCGLISISLLFTVAFAQEVQEQHYIHKDYTGGINVQSDSASLTDNQALIMKNLTIDRFGGAHKRNGYKYWNQYQLPNGDTIKYTYYFYRSKDDDEFLIATNNYIYTSEFIDTVDATSTWQIHRLKYDAGTISYSPNAAGVDSNRIYGSDTWWLLGIKEGDVLRFHGYELTIDTIYNDTLFTVNQDLPDTNLNDTTDVTYRIYRKLVGEPYIASWNNAAYIADKDAPPFYYPDLSDTISRVFWLNCVDSGTVDSIIGLDTISIDTTGVCRIPYGTLQIQDSGIYDSVVILFAAGENIKFTYYVPQIGYVTTKMTDNIGNGYVEVYPPGARGQNHVDSATHIFEDVLEDTTIVGFIDNSKAWDTDILIGDILVNGNSSTTFHKIIVNDASSITFDSPDDSTYFTGGDRYYIFEAIPYTNRCADSLKSPRFEQIHFHDNVLYAYGYEFDENGDTISQNVIFHSEALLPKMHTVYLGFDLSLSGNDRPTAMFGLNDNLVIASDNSIFTMMGLPPALGNGTLIETIPETGIPSYKAVTRRDNNYVYIADNEAFYKFNGNTIQKISLYIDPLVRKYGSGGYYVGSLRDHIYFGSIDSNYTFVYYEPTQTFTLNANGMSLFSNQQVMSDSGYFMFSDISTNPGRLYKYPNKSYYLDSLTATPTTDTFTVHYKTGWMNHNDLANKKLFKDFWLQGTKRYSLDTIFVNFRVDFDSSTVFADTLLPTVSAAESYRFVERIKLPSNLKGRYIQIEIINRSVGDFQLGEWGYTWIPVTKNTQ